MTETPRATATLRPGENEQSLSPFLTFSSSHFALAFIATLCGAVAGGALLQWGSAQWVLMALVLAGAWQVLWSALVRGNWQPARAAWRAWSRGMTARRLPYTQAGSDADKVGNDLSQFGAWVREWLLPQHGLLLGMGLAALMVMLALALAIGVPALLLSAGVLIVMQIAFALCGGNGKPETWLEGLAVIGLPFALGLLALAPAAWPLALACVLMGLVLMALLAGDGMLLHVGSVLAVGAFVLLREPAAAIAMGVMWATAALLRPAGNRFALVVLCLVAVAAAIAL